jgi:acyl-CoA thioesterase
MKTEDPDFGLMEFHVGVWEADIAWNFPPFDTAQLHLLADFSGPTNLQRQLMRELKQKFTSLWPKIADAIVECDEEIATLPELDERVSPSLRISIRDNSYKVRLTGWVPMETRCHSFVVTLRDWEILEIHSNS